MRIKKDLDTERMQKIYDLCRESVKMYKIN